jgi:rRNA maturation RNase YbeY
MSFRLSPRIRFFFEGASPNINNRRKLKSFITSIFIREKKELEVINFIFTNDKTIHRINKKYLGHNFLTDIITFELSGKGAPVIAEIYISCDRVKENATIHKTRFNEELHRVVFHGILHLCGYRDKTSRQKRIMRAKESDYLSKYSE